MIKLLVIVLGFAAIPQYSFNKENVNTFCREEWTKRGALDQRMFGHCVKMETEGYARMLSSIKKFENNSWMKTLFPAIWSKWTKRGITQYRMVGANLEGECDEFLNYEYEKKQNNFNKTKMLQCWNEWKDNSENVWSMTMYCYKED